MLSYGNSGGGGSGGGSGDVVGPASALETEIPTYGAADGKTLGNSNFTLSGVTLATKPGNAIIVSSTSPAAAAGASQVGTAASFRASNAVASTDTAGAAAGGSVTITAGNAARLTSGDANGGDITLTPGTGIGTGLAGSVKINNIGISANAIVSTNVNGDIALNPNGSGNVTTTRSLVTGAGGNGVFLGSISSPVMALNSGGSGTVDFRPGGSIVWSGDAASSSSAKDTGLKRLAAGILQGTNGGAGALTAFQLTATVGLFQGAGSPESAVTAGIGSIYLRTDGSAGTAAYLKESGTGNTGWKTLVGIA